MGKHHSHLRQKIKCAHECVNCVCVRWFSWMHMTPASSDHRFLFLALLGLSPSCLSSAMSRSIVKREPSGAQPCLQGSYPHQSHPEPAQCKETQIPCSHRDQHGLILERGFGNCACLNCDFDLAKERREVIITKMWRNICSLQILWLLKKKWQD